jgi:alkanesulfonate monooxygenase SsuD/methylene tetrahydromethanopterin reductase-like flavin-dependent oxidoreductase (luciferase family)
VPPSPALCLAVALKAGGAVPWVDQVREAQRGLLDFVTIEAGADALLVAERVAPLTRRVGIVLVEPTAAAAPLRTANAIGRLDVLSGGRAGWLVRAGSAPDDWAQAADHVARVARIWEGAMDEDQLRPVVVAAARDARACAFAARVAEVVLLAPADAGQLAALLPEVGARHAFVEFAVVLEDDAGAARERLAGLGGLAPSGAAVFAGTPLELADQLCAWRDAGATGIRLHPASTARDLPPISRTLVPELQRRAAFRTAYEGGTLREHLGLGVPRGR